MNDVFGNIFSIFQFAYGVPLSNYLFEEGRAYSQIGIAMIICSLVVGVVFYYVVDHPALNTWKGWSLSLLVNATINFIISYSHVLYMYNRGEMMEVNVTTGEAVPVDVSMIDFLNFGIAVAIVSCVAYTIISFLIKGRSINCAGYPHIKKNL